MSCLVNPHRYDAGAGGGLAQKWRLNISHVQGTSNWASIKELEMRASAGGANLCAGGSASASVDNSGANPASAAFDGNSATHWSTGVNVGSAQWIEYDFASNVTIEQIALTPFAASDTPNTFTVEYWDGAAWQIYWHVGSAIPLYVQNTNQLIFTRANIGAAGSSTAWRLNITASRSGTGFPSISELELRSSFGGSNLTVAASADGSQALANHNTSGNEPYKAFDASTATRWQGTAAPSGGSPQILGYRFPTPVTITEIAITNFTTLGDSPKTLDVQRFDEATNAWVTVWSIADTAFSSTTQTLVFH